MVLILVLMENILFIPIQMKRHLQFIIYAIHVKAIKLKNY